MNILIFITDNGAREGTGPTLLLADRPGAVLPANPRSYPWRYFATVGRDDSLISGSERETVEREGSCIVNWLVSGLTVA